MASSENMRSILSTPTPWIIFALVFGVHALSPRTTSGDSRWTVPVAVSILNHGDTNLDEYSELVRREQYYAVECVDAGGVTRNAGPGGCAGHLYNLYPVAVPALGLPFVLALRMAGPLLMPVVPTRLVTAHPEFASLLAGDLISAHAVVEEWIASFFIALAAVAVYATARRFLPAPAATLLALVLAFATPAWSTGSRAFGEHAPSMFLIALAIYLLLAANDRPSLIPYLGLVVAVAYAVRPTNALLVILASIYVLKHYRRWFRRYLLWALPVAAAFIAYDLSVYHGLFSPYFSQRPWSMLSTNLARRFAVSMAGQLVSPSRGLFVFTPMLLFSVYGMYRAWRDRWQWALSRYLIIWVVAHWIVVSLFVETWWAGHSYGPRFFTDLMPVFVFFLIPPMQAWLSAASGGRRATAAVFLVLVGASLFIHARGAWSLEAQNWNGVPTDVDSDPGRLWDWSDPQFLRGLH